MPDTGGEAAPEPANVLTARRLGIDTQHEAVVFMRRDCPVCRSEGFTAHARVRLQSNGRSIIATLYQVSGEQLGDGEMGLSESAWSRLGLSDGEPVAVTHPDPLESLGLVRAKVFGRQLDRASAHAIMHDVAAGRYSEIHLSSFVTACAATPLARDEIAALTEAMVAVGDRLEWDADQVVDKHCVGGLPGNRTTPILVPIVAACGLVMPKTSSRAITSPAGTADTMETMAPVDLDTATMRRVVEREGGCVVWGGAVRLSPADDILIRIERALDLDGEGQLVASVLSKKLAAGATHVVIDLPVGPTAKVRSQADADALAGNLRAVAAAFGMQVRTVVTDGSQPVGRGIGPALEARDVLAVLRGAPDAPADLRERALTLAAGVLELAGAASPDAARAMVEAVLDDGRAWAKFQAICEAQGGMREPPVAPYRRPVPAPATGRVSVIDNRRLARVAKLAGAPDDKAAGVELLVRAGDRVERGAPLYIVHAESPGELQYALSYATDDDGIVELEEV